MLTRIIAGTLRLQEGMWLAQSHTAKLVAYLAGPEGQGFHYVSLGQCCPLTAVMNDCSLGGEKDSSGWGKEIDGGIRTNSWMQEIFWLTVTPSLAHWNQPTWSRVFRLGKYENQSPWEDPGGARLVDPCLVKNCQRLLISCKIKQSSPMQIWSGCLYVSSLALSPNFFSEK